MFRTPLKGTEIVNRLRYKPVVYHTIRVFHTVRVYSYDMTVRIWYDYLYHIRIATIATITVYKQAIANTVLN